MTPSSSLPSPTTISPRRSPAASVEYAGFPGGQCRFILMNPNVKGHRCACVAFSHNAAMPGAMCDCGHLSCFHSTSPQTPPHNNTQSELELLKRRLAALERQTQGRGDTPSASNVEEMIQANSDELRTDMKELYRNVSGAWNVLEQVRKDVKRLDQTYKGLLQSSGQIERAMAEMHWIRDRQLEILDSDESLESRVAKLESRYTLPSPPLQDRTQFGHLKSVSPTRGHPRIQMEEIELGSHNARAMSHDGRHSRPVQNDTICTVTVFLLVRKDQDRPHRKDSKAYQRLISRGLQKVVAVKVGNGASFTAIVNKVFEPILGTRAWTPLVIQSERADESLPILRCPQKNTSEADWSFLADHCFTADHCAFIAPWDEPLTWDYIRQLPVLVQGLETCWVHEPSLDTANTPSVTSIPEDNEEHTCCSRRRSIPPGHLKRSCSDIAQSHEPPIARRKISRGFKVDVASIAANIVAK